MKKQQLARLRIAIVEDHEMMRNALARLCGEWGHGEVVIKATDGVDLEEQIVAGGGVDLAVVDLRMPRRDGYATMAWMREHQPATLLLAISYELTDDHVYHALDAGANAVVEKGILQTDLMLCLDSLRATGFYATPLMMRQLKHKPDPNNPMTLRKKLTTTLAPRELEFLMEYIKEQNLSRVAIAKKMNISLNTAEEYRSNIGKKTGAATHLAMLLLAIRFGLVKACTCNSALVA